MEGGVPETRTSKFLSRPEGSPGRFVSEFAWTFRNAPEGQTNRSTFSQENTSLGVRSSSLFIWRAVFAAWQRGHYFRGSVLARQIVSAPRFCILGSAFIIVAASCV